MRRFSLALCFIVLMGLYSCMDAPEVVDNRMVLPSMENKNQGDSVIRDSLSGSLFSRISKPATAGLTYTFSLSEELQDQHYYIVFKGNARSNVPQSKGSIVFIGYDKNSNQLCWWSVPLAPHLQYQNAWNQVLDSIHLPGLINDVRYTKMSAFFYLGDSPGERLDADTFQVTLKKLKEY